MINGTYLIVANSACSCCNQNHKHALKLIFLKIFEERKSSKLNYKVIVKINYITYVINYNYNYIFIHQ